MAGVVGALDGRWWDLKSPVAGGLVGVGCRQLCGWGLVVVGGGQGVLVMRTSELRE